MIPLLRILGNRAPMVLTLGVLLGFVLPGLGNLIEVALPLLVVMLLAAAMVRVDLPQVLGHLRRPFKLGLLLFVLMAVIPLAVHGLAIATALPPPIHIALVLLACAPPLSASVSMAAILDLDDAFSLNLVVVGTLILPFSAPALAVSLLDIPVNLEAGSMLMRLALTIGLAMLVAFIIRRSAGRRRIEENMDVIDGVSSLIMVIFAIVVMNGVTMVHVQDPWEIIRVLSAVLIANWGSQLLTVLALLIFHFSAGMKISRQDGALALSMGNRNIALFIAILPPDTASILLLFFALYQVPVYLTPIISGPIYRRLVS